ncbi:ThuA domain-containing protein [Streptomyces parvulus]|uniref:ThuA domain-containing protein n=1 Tax=Streptomyces parvulus TaxID=146923 RepID=UPI00340CC2DB
MFTPGLERDGFEVMVREDLAAYEDTDRLAATDLVVHCWPEGEPTGAQETNLVRAVEAGTGFAGRHGGVVATNAGNPRSTRSWPRPCRPPRRVIRGTSRSSFPVVWTRRWGSGRVFVCTPGHRVPDLTLPQTAATVGRGLTWAARS